MTQLTVWPDSDLSGTWEKTAPLIVDGAGYSTPGISGTVEDGYDADDSLAPSANQVTLPTVVDDDVAIVVVAVTDGTATATTPSAPIIGRVNEVQTIQSFVDSGTFTLTFDGQTTAAIAWDATAATIQTELEALSNIDVGDVIVAGGPLDGAGATVTVEFTGAFAGADQVLMTSSDAYTAPVNEVQRIAHDHTGGAFALTFDGEESAGVSWDTDAAAVETALQFNSNIDDVVVTGGALPGTDIDVEFEGINAATDVPEMTITSNTLTGGTTATVSTVTTGAPPSGIQITETTAAVAGTAAIDPRDVNLPRAGSSPQPQIFLWSHVCVAADSGSAVDFEASDHDDLHSWSVAVLVVSDLDTADAIGDVSTVTTGVGTIATFGAVTPEAGGIVLSLLCKAVAGHTTPDTGTVPSGMQVAAGVGNNQMTLEVGKTGALPAVSFTPGSSSWSQSADWVSASVSLNPAVNLAGGSTMAEVLDSPSEDDWLEIVQAAGNMFEVVELDLAGLAVGAIVTGARVEVAHDSTSNHRLRTFLVGINADDTISRAVEQQNGYFPTPPGQTHQITTSTWKELSDGTAIPDVDRLGIALVSSDKVPGLGSHRIFWARAVLTVLDGGPVVSNVAGPVAAGDPVTWDYSSDAGLGQSSYEAMVIAGSGQDPDTATAAANPMDPVAGEIIATSAKTGDELARSHSFATPLTRGTNTLAVRAWARLSTGLEVVSDWDTTNFDITGTEPSSGPQATDPVFNETSGSVDVDVAVPASVARAWLYRSVDAGSTWELVDASPYTVTPSTTETLVDPNPPFVEDVLYQVSFDNGAMNETSAPLEVGSAVSTPVGLWYLIVPDDTSLSVGFKPKAVSFDKPRFHVSAEQPGNSVTARSQPLATIVELESWIFNEAEYLALKAALEADYKIELRDIWGRTLTCVNATGLRDMPERWMALPTESTGIRDAHVFAFQLREVR